MRKIDVKIGDKKSRLTVIELLPSKKIPCGVFVRRIKCKCECGKEKEMYLKHFISGDSSSCGCYLKELTQKHGKSDTRLFRVWAAIKQRCRKTPSKKTNKSYYDKGITMCDEWKDFINFYNWSINNGHEDNLTIDRIDNSKGYSPQNCRWVSHTVNLNNRDTTIYVNYNGEKISLSMLLINLGIRHKYQTIYGRLKNGIDIHEAINVNVRKYTRC